MTTEARNWITLLVGLAVAGLVVRLIGNRNEQKIEDFQSQLEMSEVISAVAVYVERSGGQWPRGWSDLALPDHIREGDARIDFQADPDQLIDDPQLMNQVILPPSGAYSPSWFPKDELDQLRQTIIRLRRPAKAESSAPPGKREPGPRL